MEDFFFSRNVPTGCFATGFVCDPYSRPKDPFGEVIPLGHTK
jgi:hypothetical protein